MTKKRILEALEAVLEWVTMPNLTYEQFLNFLKSEAYQKASAVICDNITHRVFNVFYWGSIWFAAFLIVLPFLVPALNGGRWDWGMAIPSWILAFVVWSISRTSYYVVKGW